MSPRHSMPRAGRRRTWLIVGAVVVVALAVGGFVAYQTWWSHDTVDAASSSSPTFAVPPPTTAPSTAKALPADQPAAQNGPGPCSQVRVLASLENADMLNAAAAAYTAQPRDVADHCVQVSVSADTSGGSASDVAGGFSGRSDDKKPTVWIPDSDAWLNIAARTDASVVDPATVTAVARSGVVVAMPDALAQATSWQSARPTWGQVFATASDPNYWKSNGHPEWGTFKLAKTSPQVASSGLFALMAAYGAATGSQKSLTVNQVNSASIEKKVADSELTVAHYMTTPEQFLTRTRQAEDQGSLQGFLSAIIVDEKSVWDYNRGVTSVDGTTSTVGTPPAQMLAPIYPGEGIYVATSSGIVLSGSWVGAPEQAAGKDFLRFLGTQQGQTVVRANGYRDVNGLADDAVRQVGKLRTSITSLPTPAPALTVAVQKSFDSIRKKARVLFCLDVSGSMADPIAGGGSKLAGAQKAIDSALGYFTGDDEVGLYAFSNRADQVVTPGLVTPLGPAKTTATALKSSLAALQPISETPLYSALTSSTDAVLSGYDATKINAIVLLSDGRNETGVPGQLADVTTKLSAAAGSTPVLVFTLAYGGDADAPTLQAIAKVSGGQYYDATDAAALTPVLQDLVTSF